MVEGSVSQATTFESAPRTAFATSRRGLILAATTLALLLTGAATAFACIVAQGGMTLTNPATGESETVIGDPGDGSKFMKWCEGSEDAVTVQKGSRVEISVTDAGSGSSNCGEDIDSSNQLPDGEYVVTFTNNGFSGSGPYDDGDLNEDCMAMPPTAAANAANNNFTVMERTGATKNTFRVDNGTPVGGNPVTYIIPGSADISGSNQAAAVCVTKMDQGDASGFPEDQDAGYAYAPFVGGGLNGVLDNHEDKDGSNGGGPITDQSGGPPIGNFIPVDVARVQ